VSVYPVNYRASTNFDDRMEFANTVVDGIRDAGPHVESRAANCPNTRIVLGDNSQGAAVAGFVTFCHRSAGDSRRLPDLRAATMPSGGRSCRRRGLAPKAVQ
jgi:hypothetical protein